MTPQQVAFLQRLVADRPEYRTRGTTADEMHAQEGLGRMQGTRIYYRTEDFVSAQHKLISRGFEVARPRGAYTRGEAPKGLSEKSGAQKVTHGLVAVSTLNMPDLRVPARGFLAIPWADALALPYQVLLLVENLEALQRIGEFGWLADYVKGRMVVALYRGAPGWFRTDSASTLVASDTRPVLAFFDFDPAGLAMAASVPRREALCLPAWDLLSTSLREQQRRNLYAQSYDESRTQLDAVTDPEIALAWKRMQQLTLGLDQEHFPSTGAR